MKILFITERLPYPLDTGGKIRSFHILKGLAERHDVTLVTAATNDERQHLGVFAAFCDNVHVVERQPISVLPLLRRIAASVLGGLPIVVSRHYREPMQRLLARLIAESSLDCVHFDHLDATCYRGLLDESVHMVLDQHNVVTNQVITSARAEGNFLKKAYMYSQIRPTRRYERRICAEMDNCLVCSDTDKQYLQEISPEARLSTIPNGVDIEYFSCPIDARHEEAKDKDIIFVGSLGYGPGRVAMEYFCSKVWPEISSSLPDATFTAVGQDPPEFLLELARRDDRIRVTGRVDDIRPFVRHARVFVVPLLSGSGTRLKILDAFAMKIPVVSTTLGAEGLDVEHGENILLADEPRSFADAVTKVMSDEQLSAKLVDNGFTLVQDKYGWRKVCSELHAVYLPNTTEGSVPSLVPSRAVQ